MADLQVVYLQDVMPVTKVEPLDASVASLRTKGRGAQAASAVLINGIESPLFIVLNKNELVAEVPTSVIGDLVRSVAVLSNKITRTERSLITFRLGRSSSKVGGILRLVQRYAIMLLTSPGTDIIRPEIGGGLMNLVGRPITNEGNVRSVVQQSVVKSAKDLKKLQAEGPGLRPSEMLVEAIPIGVTFDARTTTLAIRVQITSQAGQAAIANLFV